MLGARIVSPESLRRRALALGAELEVGGKTINAGRQQLRVVGSRPAQAVTARPEAYDAARDPLMVMADAMGLQARIASTQSETTMRVLLELADRVLGKTAPPVPSATTAQQPAAAASAALPAAAAQEAKSAPTVPATAKAPDLAAAKAPEPILMPVWFDVRRNGDGFAIGLEPKFGKVTSAKLISLDPQLNADGLLQGIKPTYLN